MAKSMLVISRQTPWSGPGAREALDIALAGGAFDLPMAMLFLDDGVYQLQKEQMPAQIERKDVVANLKALPMFGVEDLYISASSLKLRALDESLIEPLAQVLDDNAIGDLINRFDYVITL